MRQENQTSQLNKNAQLRTSDLRRGKSSFGKFLNVVVAVVIDTFLNRYGLRLLSRATLRCPFIFPYSILLVGMVWNERDFFSSWKKYVSDPNEKGVRDALSGLNRAPRGNCTPLLLVKD